VQTFKLRLSSAACRGELSALINVGFQHLHELGWEWQVFDTIQKRYQLWKADNWDPGAAGTSVGSMVTSAGELQRTEASAASGGAADRRVEKCGKHLATHFLMDACASGLAIRWHMTQFVMLHTSALA
jgi:hypothetical protein